MNTTMRRAAARLMVDFQQMSAFAEDPLVLDRGEGCWLWDVDGRRYYDGLSGVMVANYGHGQRRIIAAVTAQLERLAFAAPTLATNPRALELVERLGALLPDFGTFKLLSGGSEVVEAAIKLARQYHKQTGQPGRYKVISHYRSYHGATLGALAATGHASMRAPYEPLPPGFLHVQPPDPLHPPYGAPPAAVGAVCAQAVEDVIRGEGPETVAAVLCEPVMQSAGVLVPPPDYLPRLREVCDRYGVLLLYDEVITGCGRTGRDFAFQHSGAVPDLLCLGKGLTGGYAPLACVALRPAVAAAFWGPEEAGVQFHSGHTYGGNPVACAAAVAALDLFQEAQLSARAATLGEHLLAGLKTIAARRPEVQAVRGIGLLAAVEYAGADPAQAGVGQGGPDAFGLRVAAAARERGLLLRRSAGSSILGPPLVTTREELDWVLTRLDESIAAAAGV
ncbi:MAG TPA: aminotransferase class III-fold pyridoxal phosphate-dependent enzyme [Chloroflexota bacterium]|jgi:adenosylmethionine-8-amino-7-oxononanoate aminotransferase|nr:aminotransferase class III-fold pyridoxal phosphate-dependent enzyme [Chloroflexota bacterium]